MTRSYRFWNIAMAAAIVAAPLSTLAQNQPAPPPPRMEQIDADDEPAITIRKPDAKSEITEKREHGRVTQIKVNTGRSTYYIHPNDTTGGAMPGDAQSPTVRPAEWVVHTFDIGQPKQDREGQPEPVPATPEPAK